MKHINYILYSLVLAMTCSCVQLNQPPRSFITKDQYINKAKDANSLAKAADGLYHDLWGSNYGYCTYMMRLDVQSDAISPSPTKPNNVMTQLDELSPSLSGNNKSFQTLWSIFMKVISNSNSIIEGTPIPKLKEVTKGMNSIEKKKVEEYNANVNIIKNIVGEAYFMNAFAYFNMVRIFGEVPLLLPNTVPTVNMPRASVKDIYEKIIIPHFQTASEWLPSTSRTGDSNSPDKWVAKLALAKAYMTMAGWPLKSNNGEMAKAASILKEIIDSGKHGLLSNYSDLWQQANVNDYKEFMFTIRNSVKDKTASQYGKSFYPPRFMPNSGWADYFGSLNFYNNYPNDKRKEFNYMTHWYVKGKKDEVNFADTPEGLPCISKYYDYNNGAPGKSAQSNGLTPIYRYAEVLLLYAEASTKATGSVSPLALQCLNMIEQRAGDAQTQAGISSNEFLNKVYDQYGWEFLAEFKRWFQLVRLEKVKEILPKIYNESLYAANNHYYYAVPLEQIQLTGWKNNAGY